MAKVYKALYKTDWIYADGYVVVNPDNTLEGIFAFDYMYIYNQEQKNTLFLKTLSYYTRNKILWCRKDIYEFYSSRIFTFSPFDEYMFFVPCINQDGTKGITGLSLEIEEEIFDEEQIRDILLSIMQVRA